MRKIKFNMCVMYRDKPSEVISVIGSVFEHNGFKLVAHRPLNFASMKQMESGFEVSEYTTGTAICRYANKQREAIETAKNTLDRIGPDKTREAISRFPVFN